MHLFTVLLINAVLIIGLPSLILYLLLKSLK